jgi:nucleoid DNA-binding protein
MKLSELVLAAQQKDIESFGNIHESRVREIVQAVLIECHHQIQSVEEGEIQMEYFGKFIVRRVKVEDGSIQRRVFFRAAELQKTRVRIGKE